MVALTDGHSVEYRLQRTAERNSHPPAYEETEWSIRLWYSSTLECNGITNTSQMTTHIYTTHTSNDSVLNTTTNHRFLVSEPHFTGNASN